MNRVVIMCYGARRAPKLAVLLFFCFLGLENLQTTTHKLVVKMTPQRLENRRQLQNGSKIDPGTSWRALGAVLAASRSIGSVLERSWSALEGSWSRKNKVGIGSCPAQGHLGDRFQRSWGPNALPTRAKEGPKSRFESAPS